MNVIIILIALLLLNITIQYIILYKRTKEPYRHGHRSVPMFLPIPPIHTTDFQFELSYEHDDWKKKCPSAFGDRHECITKDDCGEAEVCFPLDGIRKYCQCSIQNACIEDAVC